jgi:hypothetical protein
MGVVCGAQWCREMSQERRNAITQTQNETKNIHHDLAQSCARSAGRSQEERSREEGGSGRHAVAAGREGRKLLRGIQTALDDEIRPPPSRSCPDERAC